MKSAPGTQNYSLDCQENAFRGHQWDALQRHSAKVPEETLRTGVNCVEQSVIDQVLDQWYALSGKHVEHLL